LRAKRATEEAITCIVADDQPALLGGVSDFLSANGIDLVARVSDGASALAAIEEHRPSVAILDLRMPNIDGIEVAKRAYLSVPETKSILYVGPQERDLLVEAIGSGVSGFVRKEGPLDDLLDAVKLTAARKMYVDPALAPALVRASATHPELSLSPRESEILRQLADGKGNDEIGLALHISPDTVRTYIHRAMRKLDADTRTQAVAIALREAFIT
jgi:DNA-binding NarL/FixJ family response regulator